MFPLQICDGLKLCKSNNSPAVPVADEKCILCEYAITELDQIIEDKHNQESIKHGLEKLCGVMPTSVRDQCTKLVDQYSDLIIMLIAEDMTPEQVCTQLHLCKSALMLGSDNFIQNVDAIIDDEEEDPSDRPYCTLCEYAIGEVDKMITDKQNEEEIKNVLDAVCYELSQPIQKECVKMVTQYTDMIVEMFVAEYTPTQVCAELHLCDPVRPNNNYCLLYTSPSPRDRQKSRMPSSA